MGVVAIGLVVHEGSAFIVEENTVGRGEDGGLVVAFAIEQYDTLNRCRGTVGYFGLPALCPQLVSMLTNLAVMLPLVEA